MNSMQKIDIYVPVSVYEVLESDARLFEIFKKDGISINKNKFLRKLIIGYYNRYVEECTQTRKDISSIIRSYHISNEVVKDVAESIMTRIILPKSNKTGEKEKYRRISLKPTYDIDQFINMDQLYRNINASSSGDSLSQHLCKMMTSYSQKPFQEREQIIFKDAFEKLKLACDGRSPVTISYQSDQSSNVYDVIPYELAVGREEMFNYLLCAGIDKDTGVQKAYTMRLNRIAAVNFNNGNSTIDPTVEARLEKMSKISPQYAMNSDEKICVRFESGLITYRKIYFGRPDLDPEPEQENGDRYSFDCSEFQAFQYFKRFEDVEILEPESLRNRMIQFHQNALRMYERKNRHGCAPADSAYKGRS